MHVKELLFLYRPFSIQTLHHKHIQTTEHASITYFSFIPLETPELNSWTWSINTDAVCVFNSPGECAYQWNGIIYPVSLAHSLTGVLVMDSFFITFIEITGSPVVQEPQSGR